MKHETGKQAEEDTKKLTLAVIILLLFVFALYGLAPMT